MSEAKSCLMKFNYGSGLLVTKTENFPLEDLRVYLLKNAKALCLKYFVGTFFRPGAVVEDYTLTIEGKTFYKREITLKGRYINTYDWDAIFFHASKTDLIQNFINDNTRNRKSGIAAVSA